MAALLNAQPAVALSAPNMLRLRLMLSYEALAHSHDWHLCSHRTQGSQAKDGDVATSGAVAAGHVVRVPVRVPGAPHPKESATLAVLHTRAHAPIDELTV